jgi:hypothetical protein
MSSSISNHTTSISLYSSSSTSSSSHTPNQVSTPILIDAATPQERLIQFLYANKIIDKNGRLTSKPMTSKHLELDEIQKTFLSKILDQELCIAVDKRSFKTTLRKFLQTIREKSSVKITDIEIAGGFVRKLLLLSKESVINALYDLTGLPKEKIRPFITDELLEESKRSLPDIDIRIHVPSAQKNDLYQLTNVIVQHFSQNLGGSYHAVKNKAFSKFNVVFDQNNQFSGIFKQFLISNFPFPSYYPRDKSRYLPLLFWRKI